MNGHPVTIRTLDPPLHKFLPKREELMDDIARLSHATAAQKRDMAKRYRLKVVELRKSMPELLRRVEELHEFNPMLGHRGCRLGITYPAITEMQARAIFEAACEVTAKGGVANPEVMIPLVGTVQELADQSAIVRRVAEETMRKKGVKLNYLVGTMIEVPRAAVTAGSIAREAEFFSFGTNDLTEMAFGYSRDDAGKFLPEYVEKKVLAGDPFVSLDQEGVGALMDMAAKQGRRQRAKLKLGICGEHGGDPASVEFCHRIGLDYVSCSPFRVPIAKLAAAQAAVRGAVARSDRRCPRPAAAGVSGAGRTASPGRCAPGPRGRAPVRTRPRRGPRSPWRSASWSRSRSSCTRGSRTARSGSRSMTRGSRSATRARCASTARSRSSPARPAAPAPPRHCSRCSRAPGSCSPRTRNCSRSCSG